MRLIVDTQILLWLLGRERRLPARARSVLEDDRNERLFSAASVWEIAIKFALGRPDFQTRPDIVHAGALSAGLIELPVRSSAAARVADMARHHGDPFDRVLVAQAIDEDAILLTADLLLAAYGPPVLMVG